MTKEQAIKEVKEVVEAIGMIPKIFHLTRGIRVAANGNIECFHDKSDTPEDCQRGIGLLKTAIDMECKQRGYPGMFRHGDNMTIGDEQVCVFSVAPSAPKDEQTERHNALIDQIAALCDHQKIIDEAGPVPQNILDRFDVSREDFTRIDHGCTYATAMIIKEKILALKK